MMKHYAPLSAITILAAGLGWLLGETERSARESVSITEQTQSATKARAVPQPVKPALWSPPELMEVRSQDLPARLRQAFRQGRAVEAGWLAKRWAGRDPAALFEFMLSFQGLDFAGVVPRDWGITQSCFEEWFKRDFDAALLAMNGLTHFDVSEGKVQTKGLPAIMTAMFNASPDGALKFLTDHPNLNAFAVLDYDKLRQLSDKALTLPNCNSRPWLLHGILEAFLKGAAAGGGPEAAASWLAKLPVAARLEALPDLNDSDATSKDQLKQLAQQAFTEAEWTELSEGSGRIHGDISKMAFLRSLQDPAAAAIWATSLKGEARYQAMAAILENNLPNSTAEAEPFLASIPPGPLRDKALSAFSATFASKEGNQTAAAWAMNLPDAADQRQAIQSVMGSWSREHPDDCVAWLKQLPTGNFQNQAISSAFYSAGGIPEQLKLASKLPEDLAVEALNRAWENSSYMDSRPLAVAAILLPPGRVREGAIKKASTDSYHFFGCEYNQKWLDWASSLPTAEDRAAALKGAQMRSNGWGEGIREAATQQLSNP